MIKVNNKKMTVFLSLSILAIIAITASVTYAYLSVNAKQTTANVVETACFSTSFTQSNLINSVSYPMSSTKAFTKTPYTFTVTNNCSDSTNYQLYLNILNNSSTTLLDYIDYSLDGTTVNKLSSLTETSLPAGMNVGSDVSKSYVIDTGTISTSKTFTLYLWIDERAENDIMDNVFNAKVSVYNRIG